MIQLYPDQELSIQRLREKLRVHKSVLLQGETGSGKSIMAAYMIAGSRQKGMVSAFVVPRRDLLRQMSETFQEFGIDHSFVAAKRPFNPYATTFICTSGTLANKLARINPGLILYDEVHYGATLLDRMITHYKAKGAVSIGLSATPEKTNGDGLDEYFDAMVIGPTVRQLIDMKRLSDYRLFAPSRPDLSKIKTVAGDYARGQLADFMEHQNVLIGDAVKHYKQHAGGKLNITFCTSIKHSEMTADAFRAAGVPTVHMDGETPEDERRRIARAFARHELVNICSVDLMTFGYDLALASGIKTAVIESMSDLRPTKSRPLQRQKNGRVLRYKDYPGIILDHAGNAAYHGMPDEEIDWSLQGRDKEEKRSDGGYTVPIRQCSNCFFCHRPALTCPNCGHEYEVDSRMVKNLDGELAEIAKPTIREFTAEEKIAMREIYDKLLINAIKTGMPRGAAMRWAQKSARDKIMSREPKLEVSLMAGQEELKW